MRVKNFGTKVPNRHYRKDEAESRFSSQKAIIHFLKVLYLLFEKNKQYDRPKTAVTVSIILPVHTCINLVTMCRSKIALPKALKYAKLQRWRLKNKWTQYSIIYLCIYYCCWTVSLLLLFLPSQTFVVNRKFKGKVVVMSKLWIVYSPLCVCVCVCVCENWRGYVVKHNYVNQDVLMTITRKTTCFVTYWPSSGFLQESLWSYYICVCMYVYIYICVCVCVVGP